MTPKEQKRIQKNTHLLPSTVEKLRRLSYESGFSHGQIVDMAIANLSESYVFSKARNVGACE
ncbi:hypothetical protein [Geminocystis sp. NIES-3709]|uniref:hypothetical protein n=1 Tax=Geminocystis sp. NIES-3709 TaxID=1617448 RepID=UPI0005FCA227|nr:hypothetical protein [Geminocystis sp. NIES-3709]BAQ63899.1 hypothetical protein GM3709_664 [Geminocystis sp. NIES-3709]